MLQPRWRKVLADLRNNPLRTLLVVLSIAAGAFAVGVIAGGFLLLLHDLDADYQSSSPHVATIVTGRPFDDDLIKMAARVPGVAAAEGRSQLSARTRATGGELLPVRILGVHKPDQMLIDQLHPDGPPAMLDLRDKEVLVERSALSRLSLQAGDRLTLDLPDKKTKTLRVAGIAHDVTISPTPLTGEIDLYVNPTTMAWLGGLQTYDQLLLTVTDAPRDEAHVRAVARQVAHKIDSGDNQVLATLVSHPGEHPNAFIVRALLILLGGLGGLSMCLSGFLVVTTVTALLGQQVRQIGIMKAIGAQTGQITGMYFVLVLCFGGLALVLAGPTAAWCSYWLVGRVAGLLNFDLRPFSLPYEALGLQALAALGVPLLAALPPVIHSVRLTVREAIQHHGLAQGGHQRPKPAPALPHRLIRLMATWVGRPVQLALRNTFRRRGRLALTLATLTLGGAIFIAVFNIRASFTGTINDTLGYFLANVTVSLNRVYRADKIENIVLGVPGVDQVESWAVTSAQALAPDQKSGIDVVLLAPPADSTLIKPVLTAGRWLQTGDENAIVIGNQMTGKRPDLRVGDELVTKIVDKKYTWRIVGIFRMAGNGSQPLLYADYNYLTRTLNQAGRAGAFHVVTHAQDGAAEIRVADALETQLAAAGISVADITTGDAQRTQEHAGIDILIYFLIAMAVLIAVVGGLGLMGTMSMNVMERTREIGVMRAIGATDGAIVRMVILEGLVIGAISWGLGSALALPVSKVFSDLLGRAIVSVPLRLIITPTGFGLWLAVILALSALASTLPAWRAARLTVREVLNYE